jgi:hypothetical protein
MTDDELNTDEFVSELEQLEALAARDGAESQVITLCTELARRFPSRYQVFFHRAQAHFIRAEVHEALSDISQAAALAGNEPAVFYFRGLWELELGLLAEACDHIAICQRLEAQMGSAYYASSCHLVRAVALLKLGLFDEASVEIQSATPSDSTFVAGRLWSASEVSRLAHRRVPNP